MLTAVSGGPTAAVRRTAAAWRYLRRSNRGWSRHGADLVRLIVLCGAAVSLAAGDGSDALKALLVMGPSVCARFLGVNPVLDLAFALALAAEGFLGGSAIPWNAGGDTLPHIVLPLLSAPIVYAALVRFGAISEPPRWRTTRSLIEAATVTAACVVALGVAWELSEWVADAIVDTNYSQGYRDTREDLVNDCIGAAAGGIVVGVWLWLACRRPRLPPIVHASKRERLRPNDEGAA